MCDQVFATDIPSEGESTRTAEVQVVVTVTDVNDNAPEITRPGEKCHTHTEREIEMFVFCPNRAESCDPGGTGGGPTDRSRTVHSLSH